MQAPKSQCDLLYAEVSFCYSLRACCSQTSYRKRPVSSCYIHKLLSTAFEKKQTLVAQELIHDRINGLKHN